MSGVKLDDALVVLRAFGEKGVEYILVGGVAMNLHGIIRATEDIDVFIRPTADNIERLRSALESVFHDPDIAQISAEDLAGDYPSVRYIPPDGELWIDIVARLGEFASIDDLQSQTIERDGVSIRVATPKTLHWMKKGTLRARDHADAEALRQRFDLDEA